MHHGRTLPRAGVESHVEIAWAIASGDADQAAKGNRAFTGLHRGISAKLTSCGLVTKRVIT